MRSYKLSENYSYIIFFIIFSPISQVIIFIYLKEFDELTFFLQSYTLEKLVLAQIELISSQAEFNPT